MDRYDIISVLILIVAVIVAVCALAILSRNSESGKLNADRRFVAAAIAPLSTALREIALVESPALDAADPDHIRGGSVVVFDNSAARNRQLKSNLFRIDDDLWTTGFHFGPVLGSGLSIREARVNDIQLIVRTVVLVSAFECGERTYYSSSVTVRRRGFGGSSTTRGSGAPRTVPRFCYRVALIDMEHLEVYGLQTFVPEWPKAVYSGTGFSGTVVVSTTVLYEWLVSLEVRE